MKSILAFFLFLLCSICFVQAKFDKDDIDQRFKLKYGPEKTCAKEIEFDGDDLKIKDKDIELDGNKCDGGSMIHLEKSPNDTRVQQYLTSNIKQIGNFLGGTVMGGKTLQCGTASISKNTEVALIKPDDDIMISWKAMFGKSTVIEKEAGKSKYELDDDTKYAIIGENCFYEESGLLDKVCFPRDATVTTRDGSIKMTQLETGMQVLVGKDTYSPVIGWTHRDYNIHYQFVKVTTNTDRIIRLTKGHYIYADDQLKKARSLKPGMKLRTATGEMDLIKTVETIHSNGLFNPQTAHGDIVVDGIVATTYTTAVPPSTAHALLAPIRAAFCIANTFFSSESAAMA